MAHETGEPKNGLIFGIGIATLVTLAVTFVGLSSYYNYLRDNEEENKISTRQNPELVDMRSDEGRRLNSYALVDAKSGRVRIPVAQAMTLLAQRGRDAAPTIKVDPSTISVSGPGGAPSAGSVAVPGAATPAVSASASAIPTSSSGAPAASVVPKASGSAGAPRSPAPTSSSRR